MAYATYRLIFTCNSAINYQWLLALSLLTLYSCVQEKRNTGSTYNQDVEFELVPSDHSQVHFSNNIIERYENFFEFFAYVYNGGGVAVGDINNDGLTDIYFSGNEVSDRIYLNMGEFKFSDISESAIKSGQNGWHNGVSMIDINGDGWLDIYVCRGGWQDDYRDRTNLLYINQRDGTFLEEAKAFGLDDPGYSMQAVFFDMDNDNDLDMYLINRPDSFYLPLSVMAEKMNNPPDTNRDKLYRNDDETYIETGEQAGIVNYGYSLGVVTGDVNADGLADIFIANDYSTPDHLYINQGDGKFKDEILSAMKHISLFSMGADMSDIDNDGKEDIIVMEMRPDDYVRSKVSMPPMDIEAFNAIVDAGMHKQYMHNMLHLNRGKGHFSEISQLAGISKTDWSWSCLSADFNADGYRDLFITNGMRRDLFDGDVQLRLAQYVSENRSKFRTPQDLFGPGFKGIVESYKPVKIHNFIFKNEGGFHYSDQSTTWGLNQPSFSNGSAIADLDNDGDLDLVINNIDEEAFIYNNVNHNSNAWLQVKLTGPVRNYQGIGAKVKVYSGEIKLYQEQRLVRGYLSSQETRMFFGLGGNQVIDSLVVKWPDGRITRLVSIPVNQSIQVAYDQSNAGLNPEYNVQPMFVNLTNFVLKNPYIQRENEFNEYADQALLPHRFSMAGPRISVADINGDGVEDFYIGGSSGMPGVIYLFKGGGWSPDFQAAFEMDKDFEDMGSVFLDFDLDGDLDLFVVSGGSEFEDGHALYQDRLYKNDAGVFIRESIPSNKYNGSVVVADDFDSDGDLDLFVGGYVKPNNYPKSSESYVLNNIQGQFSDFSPNWLGETSQELGIIYDAVTGNIDTDADRELVIAGEWMPLTIFDWKGNKFRNETESYDLAETRGWWSALQLADIDGDGDQDIIAGNLGENYKFKVDPDHEFKVFAKDFDGNGTNDIFLAKGQGSKLYPIRGKECSSQQMPEIAARFPTFQSFAEANLHEIIGRDLSSSFNAHVDLFSSVLLVNNEGSFNIRKLPVQVQFSVVNGIAALDFNRDGRMDILLAGNRYDTEVETTPSDASLGCLLINKGDNEFLSVSPDSSGLYLTGDVKDLQITKFNGKILVIVSENKGPLSIWGEK